MPRDPVGMRLIACRAFWRPVQRISMTTANHAVCVLSALGVPVKERAGSRRDSAIAGEFETASIAERSWRFREAFTQP